MAITLKQISERAGVSVSTVSRVLNGAKLDVPIREETRQKILSVAAEMGYKPNLFARGLRGSRSSLLGVIVRDIADPFLNQVLKGINDAALERAYRLFLGHVEQQSETTIDYGTMFEQSHADGIIFTGDMPDDEAAVEALLRQHRYIVGITDRIKRRRYPGVYSDSAAGTRTALDYLWELGHRRIACVYDPSIPTVKLRGDAYLAFMSERANADNIQTRAVERSFQSGYGAGASLFADPNMPTAIFAATDTIAIGLLQAAEQAGVSVPNQVSIVGYDDIEVAQYVVPALTTISQSGFNMGYTAANLLMDMIAQKLDSEQVQDVIMPTTLVVRRSAGTAR